MGTTHTHNKGLALVVGIDDYKNVSKLDNAVYDANSIAYSLEKLTFHTLKFENIDIDQFDNAVALFVKQLEDFDVGVFYFAGHGIEISGKNYLLSQDTPCETEAEAIRYSMELQGVVDKMNGTSCKTKILIIDSCRNNPFANRRGVGTTNLAPIFAPQGTIIAYSTSPGQTALDGGMGKNSIYTGAILNYIEELDLPIETFFKKVRTSVHNLSKGKQTSWEHTSLIGDFAFNSGQLIHSLNIPYSSTVVVDKDYDINIDPLLSPIMSGFKSYTYDKQNLAIHSFDKLNPLHLNKNQLFIIGRNILQSADGGAYDCINFINDQNKLARYSIDGNNHLLNGVFFEMYFDRDGHLRNKVKSKCLPTILEYHSKPLLQCSFEFIYRILLPHKNKFLFIPSTQMNVLSFDVFLVKERQKDYFNEEEHYVIKSIKIDTVELLCNEEKIINLDMDIPKTLSNIDVLKTYISERLCIPEQYVSIISNIPQPNLPLMLKSSVVYNSNK